MMNDPVVLAVLAGVVLLVVIVAFVLVERRRRRRLSAEFGPEYDHAVATYGRRRGGQELEARRDHVDQLTLRDLTADEHAELVQRWQTVQARFVDQPSAAVTEADALIAETMRLRGYPIDDISDDERREADLSIAHPTEVGLYRDAAAIARRSRRNEATTEELRQAMVHYRSLFESLAGSRPDPVHAHDHGHGERAERPPERPGEQMAERPHDDDLAPPVRPGERAARPPDR